MVHSAKVIDQNVSAHKADINQYKKMYKPTGTVKLKHTSKHTNPVGITPCTNSMPLIPKLNHKLNNDPARR